MSPFTAHFPWFMLGDALVFLHILRCMTELSNGWIFIWYQKGTLPGFLGSSAPVKSEVLLAIKATVVQKEPERDALSPGSPAPFPAPRIPYPFPYFLCPLNSFPLVICSFVSFCFKLTSVGHLLIPGTAWHVLYPLSQSFPFPGRSW